VVSARHVVFRLVLLAMGCGLAYLLGEALLSVQSRRQKAPETVERTQAARFVYHTSQWSFPFSTRTVDMHGVVEAFSWDRPTDANANSHGFRTAEYTIARPADTFRVAVVGDSITWGQGVKLPETFGVLLEQQLGEALAPHDVAAEVLALGVCGSRLADDFMRIRAHVESLQPDLVVIQFFPNDLEYLVSYRRPELLGALVEHSNLLQAIRAVVEKERFWELVELYSDPSSIEWRLFLDVLDALDGWRQRTGTPVVFLCSPPFDRRIDGENFDGYTELEQYTELLDRPLAEMERLGFPVFDLLDTFRTRAGRRFLCVSEQDGHPNALAHVLIAEALRQHLEDEGLIPRAKSELRPPGPAWATESQLRDQAEVRWDDLNQDYEPQKEFFENLLQLHPSNAWLVSQVAHLYQQMGELPRACELYRSLPELEPEIASPWYQISLCTDSNEERMAALERMLERVPDHAPAVEEMMKHHANAGQVEQACATAVELAKLARYPEQFARALEYFESNSCSGVGLDFWE